MEDVEAEGRARNGHMTDDEGGVTGDENEPPVAVQTPKARPRPRPVRKGASPSKPATQSPSKSPTRSPSPTPGRSSRSLTPLSSIRDSAPPEEPEILETPKPRLAKVQVQTSLLLPLPPLMLVLWESSRRSRHCGAPPRRLGIVLSTVHGHGANGE